MNNKVLYSSLIFLLGVTSTLLLTQASRPTQETHIVTDANVHPALSPSPRTDKQLVLALEDMNQKLNVLSSRLKQVRSDVDSISLNAPDTREAPNMEEQQTLLEQQMVAQQHGFEMLFQSEVRDDNWSHHVENQVIDAFMDKSEYITAVDMQCKSSMCKLTLARSHDRVDTDDFMQAFETGVDWEGEIFLNFDPETGDGTAFLARPGQSLLMTDEG